MGYHGRTAKFWTGEKLVMIFGGCERGKLKGRHREAVSKVIERHGGGREAKKLLSATHT